MKLNRRQAIFGSIAAVFTGPTLVESVRVEEIRRNIAHLVEVLNKHTHTTGVPGPTSPPGFAEMGGDFIRQKMQEQSFARKLLQKQS